LKKEPGEDGEIPVVLILDEMNRADLSKVLGECFSLLEDRDTDVRLGGHDEEPRKVRLPPNLYVIRTMNLIDQSLEHVDFALRRRFLWFFRGFSREDFLTVSKKRWDALVKDGAIRKNWEKVEAEFEILADRALRGSAHSRNRRLTVPGRCLALPRPAVNIAIHNLFVLHTVIR
jgi:5-methylcytosine-specific restriction enzyme B